MLLNLIRRIVHILLPTRRPLNKFLKSISPDYKNLNILEIGSGILTKTNLLDRFLLMQNIYPNSINNSYGFKYLDITSEIQIEEKFDLVLCTNVLEHFLILSLL